MSLDQNPLKNLLLQLVLGWPTFRDKMPGLYAAGEYETHLFFRRNSRKDTTATLMMATMMMMMMMMTIVEMKMIVVKIIIDIIPRSTSTLVLRGIILLSRILPTPLVFI